MAAKFAKYLASYQHGLFLRLRDGESQAFWSKPSPIEKAVCDRRHRTIKKLRHQVITFTRYINTLNTLIGEQHDPSFFCHAARQANERLRAFPPLASLLYSPLTGKPLVWGHSLVFS